MMAPSRQSDAHWVQATGCRLQAAGSGLRAAGCAPWSAGTDVPALHRTHALAPTELPARDIADACRWPSALAARRPRRPPPAAGRPPPAVRRASIPANAPDGRVNGTERLVLPGHDRLRRRV